MTDTVLRSIRLAAKPTSELDRLTGNPGEIFLDSTSLSLRILNGRQPGGQELLLSDFSNISTSDGSTIDFGTKIVNAGEFRGSLTGNLTGNVTGNLTGNVTGNLTGNVTGNVSGNAGTVTNGLYSTGTYSNPNWLTSLAGSKVAGDINGNAASASQWQTARTLTLAGDLSGNVTFDGSGNITLTATVINNSVTLGTDTVGNYVATAAVSGNGLSGSASAEGATFTVTSNATATNTPSTIVYRDSSGNFVANQITSSVVGNVTGDVTSSGTSTFNTATVQNNITVGGNVIADTPPSAPSHAVNKRYTDNLLTAFSIAFGS
jgi:cytoskeletal protein CcmA (bactofilin family)